MTDFSVIKDFVREHIKNSEKKLSDSDAIFEDENYCSFETSNGNFIHVTLKPDDDEIVLMGVLGVLPNSDNIEGDDVERKSLEAESDQFRIMQFFMRTNLELSDAENTSFAYYEEYIVLQRKIPLSGLSKSEFEKSVYVFVEDLELWMGGFASVLKQVKSDAQNLVLNSNLVFA